MEGQAATETWLTPEEALAYLSEKFGVEYHINTLLKKAAAGELPSEKVGKYRRFIPSKLAAWAHGEWGGDPDPVYESTKADAKKSERRAS